MFQSIKLSFFIFSLVLLRLHCSEYAFVSQAATSAQGVSFVDLSTKRIIKSFDLSTGTKPYPYGTFWGVALTPDYKFLYVCNTFTNKGDGDIVSKIDLATAEVTNITSGYLNTPRFLAITPNGQSAVVAAASNIVLIDVASDSVSVIDNNSYTFSGANCVAITPNGKKALVTTANENVLVVDLEINKITNEITSSHLQGPVGIAISPDGALAYICNYGSTTVSVIDVKSETWIYDIEGFPSNNLVFTSNGPQYISVSPSGKSAFITAGGFGSGYICSVDLTKGSLSKPTIINYNSFSNNLGVAFNERGSKVYVVDSLNTKLVIINPMNNQVVGEITGFKNLPQFIAITPIPYPPLRPETKRKAFDVFGPFKYQKGS